MQLQAQYLSSFTIQAIVEEFVNVYALNHEFTKKCLIEKLAAFNLSTDCITDVVTEVM